MAKMNWEKNNKEKKIRDQGSEPVFILESPVPRCAKSSAPAGHRSNAATRKRKESHKPPSKTWSPAVIENCLNGYMHELIRCKLRGQSLPPVPAPLRKIYETPSNAIGKLEVEPRYKAILKKLERQHAGSMPRKVLLDPREARAAKRAERRGARIDSQSGKRDYQVTRVGKIRAARQIP